MKPWSEILKKRPYYSTYSGWVKDVVKKHKLEPWIEEVKETLESYEEVVSLYEKKYLEVSFEVEFYKQKLEQIKKLCDDNTKAVYFEDKIQYVVSSYKILEVLDEKNNQME